MDLQEIQAAVKKDSFHVMECCKATGLHPGTLYRIKQGRAKKLNPLTQKALVEYLEKQDRVSAEY